MITRRFATRALAFAPLAARKAADVLRQGVTGSATSASISGYGPPSTSGESLGQGGQGASANMPAVPRHTAFELAMKIPALRSAAYEQAWRQNRCVYNVDPDIEVYRSFSPMAKVTFQRQRNVERSVWEESEPNQDAAMRPIFRFINNLMWGRE